MFHITAVPEAWLVWFLRWTIPIFSLIVVVCVQLENWLRFPGKSIFLHFCYCQGVEWVPYEEAVTGATMRDVCAVLVLVQIICHALVFHMQYRLQHFLNFLTKKNRVISNLGSRGEPDPPS